MTEAILVLGDDVRAFLAVVRSLGRLGLEVHAAPSDWTSPALRSRYVHQTHSLPSYAASPEAWETRLLELAGNYSIGMILPCSDSSLAKLHHAGRLGIAQLGVPGPAAMAAFTDKAATRALAESLGIPVAAGELLTPETDADALTGRLGLPMAIKPRASYALRDVVEKRFARIVKSRAELRKTLAAHAHEDYLAESFFVGDGVGVSVIARQGTILQAYQHRRLLEASETGASTSRISETINPELLRSVEAMTGATKLHGVAMFEFRRDRKTGDHILLEVNPRFWGSLPLALEAGVDFPVMLHDLLSGKPVHVTCDYRVGVRKSDLLGEYYRLVGGRWKGDFLKMSFSAAAVAIRTLTPGAWDSWAADDPQPFVQERKELLRRIGDALGKRLPNADPRPRPRPLG